MKKADLDRVIKGLECCIKQAENDVYCEDIGCPYHEPTNDRARLICWTRLNKDALELLKKQEPQKRESLAMLPCKCGGKQREHWYGSNEEALVCKRCGFKVVGNSNADAIRKWNRAVIERAD